MLSFSDYQKGAKTTAIYPGANGTMGMVYTALGLNGEAGEIAEKIKKIIRDKSAQWNDEDKEAIKKEVGDVLWYLAMLCEEFRISLEDAALTNLQKLLGRKERGVLQGSGDNR